ncbi:MAG: hypothetical protein ACLT98_14375 [Eggerthellaceae bacterium]
MKYDTAYMGVTPCPTSRATQLHAGLHHPDRPALLLLGERRPQGIAR